MKRISIAVIIGLIAFSQSSLAQLTDSKWQGNFYVPGELECFLHFKKDSVDLVILETGGVIEGMKYTIAGDTLSLVKLFGGSPCGDEPGVYKWKIEGEILRLTLLSDPCGPRASAGLDSGLKKMPDPSPMKKED
ncbi:MAG: hypothetical protein EOO13_13905 [Chitinophagaceae bacterium]|nr:MAG: hypothetical protein EOO13_13905 [Chitinophagaceae bacterium]